ncbi:hypothetical protein B0T18DRAFT_385727 [Schizothecium vesticola]|uniref:Uncharacterized protein n=1 Tax=Schizothecium vesticola TaxID=314040 RepID=A0AA40F9T3_9PEZI|nr:hypothetical protein B0T18DRAFT_385727 [Schizothecium vesticola]
MFTNTTKEGIANLPNFANNAATVPLNGCSPLKQSIYLGRLKNAVGATTPDHSLPMDDPYGCIIRWYHSFALLQLCERLLRDDPAQFETIVPELFAGMSRYDQPPLASNSTEQPRQNEGATGVNLINKLNGRVTKWQTNAEKAMRLFVQGRLRDRQLGHETAILAKVGEEMAVPEQAVTARGVTCLKLASTLLRRRRPTKKLNAGRSHILRWDPLHDIRSVKTRPAPWELSCLSQHMPYILGVGPCDKDKCLERCMDFMFSDYSFMDIEERNCQAETRLLVEEFDILHKIHNLHQRTNEKAKPVFAWKRAKPRKIYHSDSAVRSVEDTPDLDKVQNRPGTAF